MANAWVDPVIAQRKLPAASYSLNNAGVVERDEATRRAHIFRNRPCTDLIYSLSAGSDHDGF